MCKHGMYARITSNERNKLGQIKKSEGDSSSNKTMSEQYLSYYISSDEDYKDVNLQAAYAPYQD